MVIINHWIMGALWFILTIWIGDPSHLKIIEGIIIKFLWAGQSDSAKHWVDVATVMLPKDQGGLGVISVTNQVQALAGKVTLEALMDRKHPLETILRHHIQTLSFKRWGTTDFSWVFNHYKTLSIDCSVALLNVF